MIRRSFYRPSILLAAVFIALTAIAAHADTIAWTKWTSGTSGNPGSATGTLTSSLYGTITVTYSGQTTGLLNNYPSWTPTATFTGGVVGNAPPAANNSVQLEGGQSYAETISFSTAVTDPILAIWSLGSPGTAAYFIFNDNEPFNDLGGGGSAEYGGTALVISGESIFGKEGNGIVQFIGTYSSLTFTTPNFENYYAFTVGEDSTLTDNPTGTPTASAVPEPGTISLLTIGLIGISRSFTRKAFSGLRR